MKIGSLCSGYGGLDLAAEFVFGAETIDFDPLAAGERWDDEDGWP